MRSPRSASPGHWSVSPRLGPRSRSPTACRPPREPTGCWFSKTVVSCWTATTTLWWHRSEPIGPSTTHGCRPRPSEPGAPRCWWAGASSVELDAERQRSGDVEHDAVDVVELDLHRHLEIRAPTRRDIVDVGARGSVGAVGAATHEADDDREVRSPVAEVLDGAGGR